MPLYMVNMLPCKDFDRIYNVHELCYIRITVEHFRNVNNPKQCHRCQHFGNTGEICNLKSKCLKCACEHLSPNCPTKGRITCTCANFDAAHPASFRGCPKNPLNHNKTLTLNLMTIKLTLELNNHHSKIEKTKWNCSKKPETPNVSPTESNSTQDASAEVACTSTETKSSQLKTLIIIPLKIVFPLFKVSLVSL